MAEVQKPCCSLESCPMTCCGVDDVGKEARKLFSPSVKFDSFVSTVNFKHQRANLDLKCEHGLTDHSTVWNSTFKCPVNDMVSLEAKANNDSQATIKASVTNPKLHGVKLTLATTVDAATQKNSAAVTVDKTFKYGKVSHTFSYLPTCCKEQAPETTGCSLLNKSQVEVSGFVEYEKFAFGLKSKSCGLRSLKDICYSATATFNHDRFFLTASTCNLNTFVGSVHAHCVPSMTFGVKGSYDLSTKEKLVECAFRKDVCKGTKFTGKVRSDLVASVALKHRLNDKVVVFASNEFGLFDKGAARKSGFGVEFNL